MSYYYDYHISYIILLSYYIAYSIYIIIIIIMYHIIIIIITYHIIIGVPWVCMMGMPGVCMRGMGQTAKHQVPGPGVDGVGPEIRTVEGQHRQCTMQGGGQW